MTHDALKQTSEAFSWSTFLPHLCCTSPFSIACQSCEQNDRTRSWYVLKSYALSLWPISKISCVVCQYSLIPIKWLTSKSMAGTCVPCRRHGSSAHGASLSNRGNVCRKHSSNRPVPKRYVSSSSGCNSFPSIVVRRPAGRQGSGNSLIPSVPLAAWSVSR